jgi:hypothetical protein
VAEPLAGEPDRRGVDQRLDFIDVVAHDAEEQCLVAVVQRVERDVFFQIVRQAAQIGHHARCLRLHRQHVGRQKAAQSQRVTLIFGESGALVEQRVAQERHAARRIRVACANGGLVTRVHYILPAKTLSVARAGIASTAWSTGCAIIS